jgi:hypothetical protein
MATPRCISQLSPVVTNTGNYSPYNEKSPADCGAFFGKRRKRRKEEVISDFHR